MARQRLGVVLLVPQPLATQVDGVRRALGDGSLGRIEPHITLVPPVNVKEGDLPGALAIVREAATAVPPLTLRLGPVTTFQPVSPVAYLAVGGEPQVLDALIRLRAGCLDGPLEWPHEHGFIPHVTVADHLTDERLSAVEGVLGDFSAEVTFDRVDVLAEQPGRFWHSLADTQLGEGAAVVGRGSLPLDLTTSGRPDFEAAALLSLEGEGGGLPFAVTARRDGTVVGVAWGWSARRALELADLAVVAEHRGQGIGRHLVAAVEALARRRGCAVVGATAPADGAPAALLGAAGFGPTPTSPAGDDHAAPARWEHQLLPPGPDR